jgi:hypothetical protein
MIHTRSCKPLGATLKMSDLSRGATALIKNLFGGNETERMISAGCCPHNLVGYDTALL